VKRIEYDAAAELELLDEIGYLELQSPGLGRRFLAEVLRAEKLILDFPDSAPEVSRGVRRRLLRTFRSSLIYTIEDKRLLILAVAHSGRRPGYWVDRI
jgi:plasmid stabilization system protein ParE